MKVNSRSIQIMGDMTLAEILASQGYVTSRIAVELNGRIIPRSEYETTIVCDDDSMEVVSIVGGG
ncbi:MAG: sulfur carrier protein ThiS [Candidatus Methanogranum gryphiswaldense]|nr:MAG: sulfur carrier protein ThiS [Candidatus Methanogranum sp. U3.2.1]